MNTAPNISLDQIYRSPPELLEMLTAVLKDGVSNPAVKTEPWPRTSNEITLR